LPALPSSTITSPITSEAGPVVVHPFVAEAVLGVYCLAT